MLRTHELLDWVQLPACHNVGSLRRVVGVHRAWGEEAWAVGGTGECPRPFRQVVHEPRWPGGLWCTVGEALWPRGPPVPASGAQLPDPRPQALGGCCHSVSRSGPLFCLLSHSGVAGVPCPRASACPLCPLSIPVHLQKCGGGAREWNRAVFPLGDLH